MRKTMLSIAAVLMVSAALPAAARGQFTAYDGSNARHTGTGGTSVARDGVEFWTDGTPARRFEILGTLTDTRSAGPSARDSVGSASIARQARSLGGDGLIVANRRRQRDGGRVGVWSGGDSMPAVAGTTMPLMTTTFVVVRYLD